MSAAEPGNVFKTGTYTKIGESCVNVNTNDCAIKCASAGYKSVVTGTTVKLTPLFSDPSNSCGCFSFTGDITGYNNNKISVIPTTLGATTSVYEGTSSCNSIYRFSE